MNKRKSKSPLHASFQSEGKTITAPVEIADRFCKYVTNIGHNLAKATDDVNSGLRINQSNSELLWLGQSRLRKDKILNLNLSEKPIYALGIYFSYNDELATEKHFYDKLETFGRLETFQSMAKLILLKRLRCQNSRLFAACLTLPMALRKRSIK